MESEDRGTGTEAVENHSEAEAEAEAAASAGDGGADTKADKKRKSGDKDCRRCSTEAARIYEGVLLSLARPSSLLGAGFGRLREENRDILRNLLRLLVRRQDWEEASGVLSVLLKGTAKERCPHLNRFKYSVAMELLDHVGSEGSNTKKLGELYNVWKGRLGVNLSRRGKSSAAVNEDSFTVRLESILFGLDNHDGDICLDARSLEQEVIDENQPIFNVLIGIIFCKLWYSSLPNGITWNESDQIHMPMELDMSPACSQSYFSTRTYSDGIGDQEEQNSVFDKLGGSIQCDSETSVMNNKELPTGVVVKRQRESPKRDLQHQHFCANSIEDEASFENLGDQMDFTCNLPALNCFDTWLCPLRTEQLESIRVTLDDDYKDAVKYLQKAVYSTSPVLAAVLPLVQLLLIGGRVKAAIDVLEKFCSNSRMELAIRLRAKLLEHVDPNEDAKLSSCYEDILNTDPKCMQSLAKLVSLHQNGKYGAESLLEMIALHLDAVFAESNMWREFALCFLEVYQCQVDQMSVFEDSKNTGKNKKYSVCCSRIPKIFIQGRSGNLWRLRCRHWLTRHFHKSILSSEIAAGDMQLLTFKAACACHMYGSQSEYFLKVYKLLNEGNNEDLLRQLKEHQQHSIGIQIHFQETAKR